MRALSRITAYSFVVGRKPCGQSWQFVAEAVISRPGPQEPEEGLPGPAEDNRSAERSLLIDILREIWIKSNPNCGTYVVATQVIPNNRLRIFTQSIYCKMLTSNTLSATSWAAGTG